jgi:uncharacterized coiled-coil protein SlyX
MATNAANDVHALNLNHSLFSTNARVKDLERVHYNTLQYFGRLIRALESASAAQQQTIAQLTTRVTELETKHAERFESTVKRIMFLEADLHAMQPDHVIGGCGSPVSLDGVVQEKEEEGK